MTRTELSQLQSELSSAVEREGLRPFAERIRVPLGIVRQALITGNLKISSVAILCTALDLEFYVGRHRNNNAIIIDPCSNTDFDVSGDDCETVPLRETEAAAGDGFVYQGEEVVASLAFRRKWLLERQIDVSTASLIRIRGESMMPTIAPGDIALVDHRLRDVRDGKISILRVDDQLFCKQLYKSPHHVIVTSDNIDGQPQHKPWVLDQHVGDVQIIGGVRWIGRDPERT
ncbi:MAG: S24 family peptidase [Pseudomonadota bacterium]